MKNKTKQTIEQGIKNKNNKKIVKHNKNFPQVLTRTAGMTQFLDFTFTSFAFVRTKNQLLYIRRNGFLSVQVQKFTLEHATNVQRGSRGITLLFLYMYFTV